MRDEILESLEWFEVMQCPEAFNCIYVWRNKANGKTYVGKAEKLHERRYKHLRAKDNYHFHKSLRKRGAEGYQLAIIVKDVPTEELGDIEIYYIDVLDSLSKNGKGYNDALGGNGGNTLAGKSPEEMDEFSKKASEAKKGENNPNYGKKRSKETKEKMSEALKGESNPMYGRTGADNPRSRVVVAINIKNPTITIEYVSMSQAEKDGFNTGGICECCKGRQKTHKGYYWCYKEDYKKILDELLRESK